MKPTIRCSSLNQLLGCPGSRTLRPIAIEKMGALAAAFDDDESTQAGSWTHYRSALRLITEAGAVGEPEKPAGPEPQLVDKFEQWVENYYFETVLSYTSTDFAIAVERRITVEFPRFFLSGQLDCFTINADATEADINDLKTGYRKVDAAEYNWQLFGYLVLLLRLYPTLKKVRLRIIQPRNEPDDRVSETELEVTPDLEAVLVAAIEKALDSPMELETGPKQCRWCVAQLICPALKLLREHMKATLTTTALQELAATPNDLLLGEWVRDGKILAAPIENSRELIKERVAVAGTIMLEDGTEISVKDEKGQRKVTDVAAAKERLEANGIPFIEVVTVSVASVEEQVAKIMKLPKSSKKPDVLTAPKWVQQNFSDCYEQAPIKKLVIQ